MNAPPMVGPEGPTFVRFSQAASVCAVPAAMAGRISRVALFPSWWQSKHSFTSVLNFFCASAPAGGLTIDSHHAAGYTCAAVLASGATVAFKLSCCPGFELTRVESTRP